MPPKLWPGEQCPKRWLSPQPCLSRRDGTSQGAALHACTCVCFQTSTPVFSSSWVQFELIMESKVLRTWAGTHQPHQMRVRRRRHRLAALSTSISLHPCPIQAQKGLWCFWLMTKFSSVFPFWVGFVWLVFFCFLGGCVWFFVGFFVWLGFFCFLVFFRS